MKKRSTAGSGALRGSKALGPLVRPGLRAVKKGHKPGIHFSAECSIDLDAARAQLEPNAPRWDYLLVTKPSGLGEAVEVHQAKPDQAKAMIAKKAWARALLGKECPGLTMNKWWWVVPKDAPITLLPGSSEALLVQANGIELPRRRVP